MITIKLFGGAKKTFPNHTVRASEITISELLHDMIQSLPPETPAPDTKNILIAINGVDSSALAGRDTIIHDGDVVSIIPIIHGGSDVLWFEMPPYTIMVLCARTDTIRLDELRHAHPNLRIQAVNPAYILNESHLRRILEITISSDKNHSILSNSLEIDIIQRLAGTTQISRAIHTAGVMAGDTCIIISLGEPDHLRRLLHSIPYVVMKFSKDHKILYKVSGFAEAHRHAGYSLEDMLIERASILR